MLDDHTFYGLLHSRGVAEAVAVRRVPSFLLEICLASIGGPAAGSVRTIMNLGACGRR
jgi:hypothetical protein